MSNLRVVTPPPWTFMTTHLNNPTSIKLTSIKCWAYMFIGNKCLCRRRRIALICGTYVSFTFDMSVFFFMCHISLYIYIYIYTHMCVRCTLMAYLCTSRTNILNSRSTWKRRSEHRKDSYNPMNGCVGPFKGLYKANHVGPFRGLYKAI